MGTIHRCQKCGIVLNRLENNPGGLCDSCDEKASPVYWPNWGAYPFEAIEQHKRWKGDLEYLKSYNRSRGINPYFTQPPPKLLKKRCWKCKKFNGTYDDGLCQDCFDEMMRFLVIVVGLGIYLAVVFFQVPFLAARGGFDPSWSTNILGRFVMGALLLFLDAIFLFTGGVVIYLVVKNLRSIYSWVSAALEHYQQKKQEWLIKEQQESVERAKMANPQRLNGAQLDALLTEEFKKKMEWD